MKKKQFSFSPDNRLVDKDSFTRILAKSFHYELPHFKLRFRTNDNIEPRLGLILAKKKINKAVLRNKLRRLIRESFRKNKAKLTGVDIVVIPKWNIATSKFKELEGSLLHGWLAVRDKMHHVEKNNIVCN